MKLGDRMAREKGKDDRLKHRCSPYSFWDTPKLTIVVLFSLSLSLSLSVCVCVCSFFPPQPVVVGRTHHRCVLNTVVQLRILGSKSMGNDRLVQKHVYLRSPN